MGPYCARNLRLWLTRTLIDVLYFSLRLTNPDTLCHSYWRISTPTSSPCSATFPRRPWPRATGSWGRTPCSATLSLPSGTRNEISMNACDDVSACKSFTSGHVCMFVREYNLCFVLQTGQPARVALLAAELSTPRKCGSDGGGSSTWRASVEVARHVKVVPLFSSRIRRFPRCFLIRGGKRG